MDLPGIVPEFVMPYHERLKKKQLFCQHSDLPEKKKAIQWLIRHNLAKITFTDPTGYKVKAVYSY